MIWVCGLQLFWTAFIRSYFQDELLVKISLIYLYLVNQNKTKKKLNLSSGINTKYS